MTDAKVDNNIVTGMDAAVEQIAQHYAGRKAIQWLSGLKNPPIDATKDFGSWSVRAIASNSNNGTAVFDLTRAN